MPAEKTPYSPDQLFSEGPQKVYSGRELDEIAFPLGGIGTGTVSLGGWGQLRDWEIMNRPAKGRTMPNAFFAVRVVEGKKEPRVKVLQGPAGGTYRNGGHTAHKDSGEGLPHFRDVTFKGEYPFAEVGLSDDDFPVEGKLLAFNPFIPLNEDDSGIPVAVFLFTLTNRTSRKLKVSLMGNLTNIIGGNEGRTNEAREGDGLTGLVLGTTAHDADHPAFGTIALTTPAADAWVWPRWHDGRILKFWEAIAWNDQWPPVRDGGAESGTLGVDLDLAPGASVTVPFILAWSFPNFEHWGKCEGCDTGATWKNWYATRWSDAWDAAKYMLSEFDRLYDETRRYHDSLFETTLPTHVLDAVSSQISILRTNTCLRLTDGTFYGFEGCSDTVGCCEGSCTHVWNYAQALPYLFPRLQQSQREADWANSMLEDGFVCFRMPLPLGTKGTDQFHPAADGQLGSVIQVYREWLISGDDDWLRMIWPSMKRALEFTWKYWDADRDGIMEGLQHNTYDMEWWGANSMCGSLYLGALRAAEEIARYLGEPDKAAEYRALFDSGSALTDERMFNGEYYEQIVNPQANEGWPQHLKNLCMGGGGPDDRFPDWPKWQFGKGCLSDQLIGQWYAKMLGLGYLYKRTNVRKTLQSIFRYNWLPDLSDHFCSLRIYALNDEAGLLIGTWPRGERPGYAFWFCDEVWCGIEYQVASHLIYEGFVEEGLAIVRGVRDRHTGERRNPWDEFECGHHYSRSMASYALLTALSGFSYSAPEKRIGFAPRVHPEDFRCFFSVGSGWGVYSQKTGEKTTVRLRVDYGTLEIQTLTLAFEPGASVTAKLGRREVACSVKKAGRNRTLLFDEPVTIGTGEALVVTAAW